MWVGVCLPCWRAWGGRGMRCGESDLGWPLVGRAEELAFVDRAMADGRVRGVVLAGAAGVGKTRLAREVLRSAAGRGAATCWVAATDAAATLPLGAFAPLLPTLGGIDRVDLLGRVSEQLVTRAGGRRLVLGVDDAHLLDQTSTALVCQLVMTESAFVVLTVCRRARVAESITMLWKDELAERLELAALSRPDTRELLSAALGGQVDGATWHQLFDLTLGNALFLRELVRGGLATGALRAIGGVWRWDGPMGAPPRLIELVTARIGHLTARQRAPLELVAFGEPLPAGVLQRAGVPGGELEELERAGLLTSETIGHRVQVRLAHPLFGEVLRSAAPALWARTANRELAEAFEFVEGRRAGGCARLAAWRLAAGVRCDPALLVEAGHEAVARLDPTFALHLARAAIEAGAGHEAHYLLATSLARCGHCREAEAAFSEGENSALSDAERASVATERAHNLRWGLDRPGEAEAVLCQAERVVAEPAWRAELATARAGFRVYDGHCAEALRLTSTVLQPVTTRTTTRLRAVSIAGQALGLTGRLDQAIAATRRGLEDQHRADGEADPLLRLQLEMGLVAAYVWSGRLLEAQRLAQDGYDRGLARRSSLETVAFGGWLAAAARARGQLHAASQVIREAVERGRSSEVSSHRQFLHRLLADMALCAALTGEVGVAETALAQATSLPGSPSCVSRMWCGLAQLWVTAAWGERSTAVQLALGVADEAARHDLATFELIALHDIVRLGEPADVVARLRRVGSGVEGPLARAFTAHATAAAAGDGAGLSRAVDQFSALGAQLLAAEAAARAAAAFRAAGSCAQALAEAARARTLAGSCEGARTPALNELEGPPGLTRREREIAELAACGLSSKNIAQRLVVSVRTVDNTLHEVYGKLGINRRAELVPLFGAHRSGAPSGDDRPRGRVIGMSRAGESK